MDLNNSHHEKPLLFLIVAAICLVAFIFYLSSSYNQQSKADWPIPDSFRGLPYGDVITPGLTSPTAIPNYIDMTRDVTTAPNLSIWANYLNSYAIPPTQEFRSPSINITASYGASGWSNSSSVDKNNPKSLAECDQIKQMNCPANVSNCPSVETERATCKNNFCNKFGATSCSSSGCYFIATRGGSGGNCKWYKTPPSDICYNFINNCSNTSVNGTTCKIITNPITSQNECHSSGVITSNCSTIKNLGDCVLNNATCRWDTAFSTPPKCVDKEKVACLSLNTDESTCNTNPDCTWYENNDNSDSDNDLKCLPENNSGACKFITDNSDCLSNSLCRLNTFTGFCEARILK